MIFISYQSRPVAYVTDRAHIKAAIADRPASDPVRRVVCLMAIHALDVAAGVARGPYSDETARAVAREQLIPLDELLMLWDQDDEQLAAHWAVPAREVAARRAELT